MTERRTQDPRQIAKELPHIPLHRPGEPWEIARLAVCLASSEADYVTGQSFTIDGGLEMNWARELKQGPDKGELANSVGLSTPPASAPEEWQMASPLPRSAGEKHVMPSR